MVPLLHENTPKETNTSHFERSPPFASHTVDCKDYSRAAPFEAAKFFVVPHGATHLGPQPTRRTLKSLISHWLGCYYPRFAPYPSLQWLSDKLQDDTKSTDL